MEQHDRLQLLKEILLTDEKEVTSHLIEKIARLEKVIEEQEELAKHVNPIVDVKIDAFVKEMPTTISPVITKALKNEIKNSQDAVVEALFPIIGKMIKKYISHEIQLLNDRITKQINEAFSFKGRFKSKAKRSKIVGEALAKSQNPELLQLLVIEKESGILKASYNSATSETIDEDMIAGMLTAIKSFVEDAFKGGDQSLETIKYEFYTLHIQNFHKYYIVAVVNGVYTIQVKDKLEDMILDFAENGISKEAVYNDKLLSNELKIFFSGKSI